MLHFTVTEPMADVFHIQDAGQVCFTLIRGAQDTLLWDTGMGFYDVAACIAPYIRGKLHVVLSHAHYDHACGQHYFAQSLVHPVDLKRCRKTVSRESRASILKRMSARGILEDGYDTEQFLSGTPETVQALESMSLDLGGLEVQFIPAPGHTAGSIVAYIESKKLLLTGDTWNPHTWLFFPESQSLKVYTKTAQSLRDLPAKHVLRSHDLSMVSMDQLQRYIDGLAADTFASAQPCPVPP
ncbi:MAG TPA: MBL fold metallo-hydrolase, partial [Candidatus Limiplasma sp.]|nr:MBL fold metallo-hydrolase [Candidatus Limiplasma sp.]